MAEFDLGLKGILVLVLLTGSVSGVIYTGTPSAQTTINSALIIYGNNVWTTTNRAFIANHFDLVDMDFNGSRSDFFIDYATTTTQLKAINPDLKIIGYRDIVYSKTYDSDWSALQSSWFMKDISGNYIYNSFWQTYLMDISNTAYQQHIIDFINIKLTQGEYDGVFLDDVWNQVSTYQSGFNATVTAAKTASWHSDMTSFLTHINQDVSSLIIANSDEFATDDYISQVDGQMLEGFIHAEWNTFQVYDTTHNNLGTALNRKSALDKIVFCASGSTPDNSEQVLTQCYNNFVNNSTNLANSYFSFNSWWNPDGAGGYYSIMDGQL